MGEWVEAARTRVENAKRKFNAAQLERLMILKEAVQKSGSALEEAIVAEKDADTKKMQKNQALKEKAESKLCEWMFEDAGSGWVGIQALARLNPLRWSGPQTYAKTLENLKLLQSNGVQRSIKIKAPPGVLEKEYDFDTVQGAIDFLINGLGEGDTVTARLEDVHLEACEQLEAARI